MLHWEDLRGGETLKGAKWCTESQKWKSGDNEEMVGSQHKNNQQMVADSDCWNVAFINKSNDGETPVNQSCQWGNQAMLKKKNVFTFKNKGFL